jgi:anti-anti-sigma regulatory factor
MELVITLAGDYDVWTIRRLCREIAPAFDSPAGVVVDMSRVNFMDAACANEVIKVFERRTAPAFGPTRLLVSDPQTRELLLLLGLDEASMRRNAYGRTRRFERPA